MTKGFWPEAHYCKVLDSSIRNNQTKLMNQSNEIYFLFINTYNYVKVNVHVCIQSSRSNYTPRGV